MNKESRSSFGRAASWLLSFVMLYVAFAVVFSSVERTPLVVGGVGVFLATWAVEALQGEGYKGGGIPLLACVVIVIVAASLSLLLSSN